MQSFPSSRFRDMAAIFTHTINVRQYEVAKLVEATSQKVTDSNPDIIAIFNCYNPSDCTMELPSTHPLTEMNISNISWG